MKNKKLFAILTLVCFLFTLMPMAAWADVDYGAAYDQHGYTFTINGVHITTPGYYKLDGTQVQDEENADILVTNPAGKDITYLNGTTWNDVDRVFELEHTDWEKEAVGVYVAGNKITETGYYNNDGTSVSENGPIYVDMSAKKITLNGANINLNTTELTLIEDLHDPKYPNSPNYKSDVYDGVNGVKGVLVIAEGNYRYRSTSLGKSNWDSFQYWPVGYDANYEFGSIALGIMSDNESNQEADDWTLELNGENTISVTSTFAKPYTTPTNDGRNYYQDAGAYGVFAEGNLTITGSGTLTAGVNNNWVNTSDIIYNEQNSSVAAVWVTGDLNIVSGTISAETSTTALPQEGFNQTLQNPCGAIGAAGDVMISGQDTNIIATDKTSGGIAVHGGTSVTITDKAEVTATSSADIAGSAIAASVIDGWWSTTAPVTINEGAKVTATATSTSENEAVQSSGGIAIYGSEVKLSGDASEITVIGQTIGIGADVVSVESGNIVVNVESEEGTAVEAGSAELAVGEYGTPVNSEFIAEGSVIADGSVMPKEQLTEYTAKIDKTYYTGEDGGDKAIADVANNQTVWLNANTTASRGDFKLGNTVIVMLAEGKIFAGTLSGPGVRADIVEGYQEEMDGVVYTKYVYTMVVDNEQAEAKIIHTDGTETYCKDAASALSGGYGSALQAGDTVVLLKDSTITSNPTVYEAITLDLNGKTLNLTKNNGLSFSYSSSYSGNEKPVKMMIKDSSTEGTGKIVNSYSSTTGVTVNVKQNAEVTIESGFFEGKTTATGGTLILNSGTYYKEVVAGTNGTVIVTENAVVDDDCNVHANGGILILPGEVIGGDISKTAGIDDVKWKLLNSEDEPASADDITAGNCKLVIYGQGAMKEFSSSPWLGYNDAIAEIIIQDGVTNIGQYAFYNMNGYDLTIGNDVETIGSNAFNFNFSSQHNAIGNVRISAGMTANLNAGLNPPIKSKTTTIEKVIVEEGNTKYSTDAAGSVLYYKDDEGNTHLMKACTSIDANYVIPDGIVKIYSGAFDNVLFESVTVPSSFGSTSFTFEKPIVIPDGMTLGDYAYYNNEKLSVNGNAQKGADEYTITPEDTQTNGFKIYMSLGYEVTYNTGSDTIITVVPASQTLGNFAPVISADGKELKGWSAIVDGTEDISATAPTSAMTVYAIWETDETFTPEYDNTIELESIPAQTYTGQAIKPAVYYTDGDGNRKQVAESAVTYENNVNAGTATAIVTVGDDAQKTVEFTINKAPFDPRNYSFAGAKNVNYDGQKHALTIENLPEGITAIYTYDGVSADGVSDVKYDYNGSATSYTVKATFNLGNNYEFVSGLSSYYQTKTGSLTINPIEVTIAANNATMYVGESPTLTYTATGLSDTVVLTTEPTLMTSASGNKVGNFPITASSAVVNNDSNNYKIIYEEGILTVGMKVLDAAISFANDTVTYDGQNHTLLLTVEGTLPESFSVAYTLNGELFNGATEAGSYELTATISTNDPAYNSIEPMTAVLTIAPAEVVIKADSQTIYVGDTMPELTYTVTGLMTGDTLSEVPTLSCDADTASAGTYDIIVSGGAVNSNYVISYEDGVLTVEPRPSYGGGYYTPSTFTDAEVTSPNEDVQLTAKAISTSALNDAKEAVAEDENAAVIGGKDSAVQISAKEDGKVLDSFVQPVTVTVPVNKSALKDVENVNNLTLALVTEDENGETVLTYVGGNYDAQEGTFTAYTNQPGNYVLVEKSDIVKIDMFIGNTTSMINGEAVANDVAAYIANDRTMVPAAFIMDQLGCKVDWFGDERKVVITLPDGSQLSMIIDQEIPGFGAVPVIKDDRTMVPIAYIADAMGAHVLWVGDEYRVVIVK